mmetsp:Transcript_11290/g.21119  ORF Transcript_11290/g.21119 Transcript_11290/m.21119 type:complete len:795 (-) Transcript_11290:1146-3530(-)|eukprot:CAMPEP_0176505600 /NCGR_PEP_ID=MMETSP0200_2-20121128/16586_1 /TAXON_ID=947934 /ORGANISM="Chaetoceros sp., Strain GSL56" /LENGTH=794 /DNA_ID=CAMNT_0017905175 /DNA_START=268 /DNA_END=2652 /DNA_ORIENTATION=-
MSHFDPQDRNNNKVNTSTSDDKNLKKNKAELQIISRNKKVATTSSLSQQQQLQQQLSSIQQSRTVHTNDRLQRTNYPSVSSDGGNREEFHMNRTMSTYGYVRSPYGWFFDPTYHPAQPSMASHNGCAPSSSSSFYMPHGDRHPSHHYAAAPVSSMRPTRPSPNRSDVRHDDDAKKKDAQDDTHISRNSRKSSTYSSSAFVPHHMPRSGTTSSESRASFNNNSNFLSSTAMNFYSSSSKGNLKEDPRFSPSISPCTTATKNASALMTPTSRIALKQQQQETTPFEPHRVLLDITNRSWGNSATRRGVTTSKQSSKSMNDTMINKMDSNMNSTTMATTAARVSVSLNSSCDESKNKTAKRTVDDLQSVCSSATVHSTSPSLSSSSSLSVSAQGVNVVEESNPRQNIKRQRSTSSMSGASNYSSSSSESMRDMNNHVGNQNSRGMLDLLCEATDIVMKNMMEQKEAPRNMIQNSTLTDASRGGTMTRIMTPLPPPPLFVSGAIAGGTNNQYDKSFFQETTQGFNQENFTPVTMSRHSFIKPIQPVPTTTATTTTVMATTLSHNPKTTTPSLRISPSTNSTRSDGKLPKPCSCPRSKCIKLYCDCFQAGNFCSPECSCKSCKNTALENGPGGQRTRAIQNILARNPFAFHKDKDILEKLNNRAPGINCRCVRSQCLKLYCDCFQAGQVCGDNCLCVKCMNTVEESGDYGKRSVARAICLSRNPDAFKKKVKKTGEGCSCKNSRCLKKYCDCFNNGSICSSKCICRDCENKDPNAFMIKNHPTNNVELTGMSSLEVMNC